MTDYPFEEIIKRSRKGRKAIYPEMSTKLSISGADIFQKNKRYYDLDDLILVPPQFTPERLQKSYDLIYREPFFGDVDISTKIGGFKTSMPIIQASMGSPEQWNKVALFSAKTCAELGIIYGIGESVANTWGYDTRKLKSQPCLLERILMYLEHINNDIGGVVIQQNEEDAYNELWNRIYTDPRITPYLERGLIAFEIKGGQGAKSGIGGEKIIDRETALKLKKGGYIIYPDPEIVIKKQYERHSAPDIFTEDILFNRIMKLKNDYPLAKIWFKTGAYRDLLDVIKASRNADNITIDGKDGGTGMAPNSSLKHLGLPTLACLSVIQKAKELKLHDSIVISGRLFDGSHIVKAIALGANGVALGRPFVISAYSYLFAKIVLNHDLNRFRLFNFIIRNYPVNKTSNKFIRNYIETLVIEIQLLISALGKYKLDSLDHNDINSLRIELSDLFNIKYIYEMPNIKIMEFNY